LSVAVTSLGGGGGGGGGGGDGGGGAGVGGGGERTTQSVIHKKQLVHECAFNYFKLFSRLF
jgi:hypothetical protein